MTLWVVRTWTSLCPLHMCSLVFGIKGISLNISASISLLNLLSDTVLKLQVNQPSPNSVSPHLSEVTILCSAWFLHSCSTLCILVSKVIIGLTMFLFLLLRNRITWCLFVEWLKISFYTFCPLFYLFTGGGHFQ